MEKLKETGYASAVNQFSLNLYAADKGETISSNLLTCITEKSHIEAIKTIRDLSTEFLLSGKFEQYIQFLEKLPPQTFELFPLLLVYRATAMLFCEFSRIEVIKILESAEHLDKTNELKGEIAAIKAVVLSYTDEPERGIRLSLKALSLMDPGNTFFINLIERNLGVAYTIKGNLSKADFWLERLLMSSYKLEDWGGVLAAYNYLTFIRKVQGRLNEANVIYKKALAFIEEHHLECLPHSIKIYSGYGHLLLQWHQLKLAKDNIYYAVRLAAQTDKFYGHTAYQNLSEAFIRENDIANAYTTLEELSNLTQGKDELYERIHIRHTMALKSRIFVEDGKLTQAYEWLVNNGFDELSIDELQTRFGYELGFILPIAARIYIAKGMVQKAIEILNSAIPRFIHQGSTSFLIRALNALAIAYYENNEKLKSEKSLSKAVELAKPENNYGDFIFLGKKLEVPLMAFQKTGFHTSFISQILKIFSEFKQTDGSSFGRSKNDPLSRREMDVLQLIASGMTNREIADKLYLSANTIKSHSINIYRKLNVNNRRHAVSKARNIGLLPSSRSGTITNYT
jgi:LuxR family maltose regulon positive regulatory protein